MTDAPARADLLLARLGYFESRARARAAIEAGLVRADGRVVAKPSELLSPGASIEAGDVHPFVSRGGVKLAHALDSFRIDPAGRFCLDIGASTGGFTDALLARGARHVVAVDVGRDQLHDSLRDDARILSLEGQDARTLEASQLPQPPSLVVCDASFIPLARVLPRPLSLAASGADLVALVKPQFELGRGATKKGIVRDPALHAQSCAVVEGEISGMGWRVLGIIASPITGGDGNREFLLHARND